MNGQDWPAGTVATATVDGLSGVRVMRAGGGWLVANPDDTASWRRDDVADELADVRPLVVLDIEDMRGKMFAAPTANELPTWLRKLADSNSHGPDVLGSQAARLLADQIEDQVKPPRIPEPGLWTDSPGPGIEDAS